MFGLLWFMVACRGTEEKIQESAVSQDADGDGYSIENDCNDNNAEISPDAEEICDGQDNDCDGLVDDDDPSIDPNSQATYGFDNEGMAMALPPTPLMLAPYLLDML